VRAAPGRPSAGLLLRPRARLTSSRRAVAPRLVECAAACGARYFRATRRRPKAGDRGITRLATQRRISYPEKPKSVAIPILSFRRSRACDRRARSTGSARARRERSVRPAGWPRRCSFVPRRLRASAWTAVSGPPTSPAGLALEPTKGGVP
jgi:hypothetical protein